MGHLWQEIDKKGTKIVKRGNKEGAKMDGKLVTHVKKWQR